MVTTIQISDRLLGRLKNMKISGNESYEDIIWDMVEDHMELSDEAKNNISVSQKEIKEGKTISLNDIKRKIGIKNVPY